jgi:hypothetical protein
MRRRRTAEGPLRAGERGVQGKTVGCCKPRQQRRGGLDARTAASPAEASEPVPRARRHQQRKRAIRLPRWPLSFGD